MKKILIVDDDEVICENIEILLADEYIYRFVHGIL